MNWIFGMQAKGKPMQLTADAIFEIAMNMPENQRLDLAIRLLDTVRPPNLLSLDDPGFLDELDRRASDDSGSVPWKEIRDWN